MERFWAKVNKNGPTQAHRPDLGPCWLWIGSITATGYGRFSRSGLAHRISFSFIRPIPTGLDLDHLCRVRHCVNPSHLEPKTRKENMNAPGSMVGVPTGLKQSSKTHCLRGHEFSGENMRRDFRGHRACRACFRIHSKNHEERKKWKRSQSK